MILTFVMKGQEYDDDSYLEIHDVEDKEEFNCMKRQLNAMRLGYAENHTTWPTESPASQPDPIERTEILNFSSLKYQESPGTITEQLSNAIGLLKGGAFDLAKKGEMDGCIVEVSLNIQNK